MRHSHLVSGISGMITNVHLRPGQERFVSFLPLAHILALQIENVLLSVGGTLCYTDPREMSKSLTMFTPTIFAGVPKVYEMLKIGLEKKLQKGPAPLRLVFETLLSWKIFVLKMGFDTPASNKFFNLIATKVFGGRLQFAVSGGGPLGASLHYFARAVFNCPVIQGYALTETCVGGCFQAQEDTRTGLVGPPVPCVEVVLQSEAEFKDNNGEPYLHTDTTGSKGEAVLGRGEICMRGPCIAVGYYKNPEKTKEDFDEEGYFHTGDIGQFTQDGVIQIIDRKKNLVKLKGGEYVAIEAMETAFTASKYVSTLCVVANGDLDGPLVIVCTENGALKKWAKEQGLSGTSPKDLSSSKQAREEVIKSLISEGRQAGLTSLELRIKDCCLVTDDEWTPGHGMTASMKLDRKSIFKIHEKELNAMYLRQGVSISD
jgi:long-chain acyl-CoA synthetase